MATHKTEIATLGGGCFWCMEAVFKRTDGVISVTSGYAGGSVDNPTYEQVCTGTTGHAEVVRIEFDPSVVGFDSLLELFFKAHDPTTLNRQGADIGTQYRSAIFTSDDEQMRVAESVKRHLGNVFRDPVVTEILPLGKFYPAEDYHQDYFDKNPTAGYCRAVIAPKLDKMGMKKSPLA